jgi:hypothetical protein
MADSIKRSGRYPTLVTLIDRDDFDPDFDAVFEFGLHCLLDGVEMRVRRALSRP